ncbi:predicted protein [Naegleria gruberi]|uniref:Predicted protein n=1 Tax=Naegleria gruberi TaxID=5762 RepID=D2VGU0_NAEGR|nr:uncharacterized protein NAEGRDRAFT_56185 [Naegleria gruberi]EFC44027.1 predicted protein [Naegleria gruberi]|eukprot:XP_002676771.1 predicted protein [Naegleria gruberi strain NEG-M]
MHNNSIHEYFHGVQLAELIPAGQKLVVLKEDETLQEVVNQLSTHHLLAAPVVDKQGKLVGMLSMLDIVQFIVASSPENVDFKNWQELEISGRCINLQTVKHVMGFSARDQYMPLKSNLPATMAIELFAKGVHRAIVEEDVTTDKYIGTLSQTDILKRLAEHLHMGKMKQLGEQLVKDLGLGLAKPVTIDGSENVLHAMKELAKANVSALPVVDHHGHLVGNFSASDLRGFYLDRIPHFELTTRTFLEKYSPKSLVPFFVELDGLKFVDLVKKLTHPEIHDVIHSQTVKVDHSMHRVWVVSDERKVVGVITLTDIMKVIIDHVEMD